MDSESLSSGDKDTRNSKKDNFVDLEEEDLDLVIDEYRELLEIQAEERDGLLSQVEELSSQTDGVNLLDNKLDHLISLLQDVRNQISALSTASSTLITNSVEKNFEPPHILAKEEEIEILEKEINKRAEFLDNKIKELTETLDFKQSEVNQKDEYIEQLNIKLETLASEKEQLANRLESLNSISDQWKGQLDLFQKLARTDPRYKTIDTLKRHGTLSEIQLAFSMGITINQIRKYAEDLIKLNLVQRDQMGRYKWVGKEESI